MLICWLQGGFPSPPCLEWLLARHIPIPRGPARTSRTTRSRCSAGTRAPSTPRPSSPTARVPGPRSHVCSLPSSIIKHVFFSRAEVLLFHWRSFLIDLAFDHLPGYAYYSVRQSPKTIVASPQGRPAARYHPPAGPDGFVPPAANPIDNSGMMVAGPGVPPH